MAIVQPNLPDFANGDTPSGDTVSETYYEAVVPTIPLVGVLTGRDILPSFEMINGWMDDANLRDDPGNPGTGGGWGTEQDVTDEQIAPGALTRLKMAGATANVDFFKDLFALKPAGQIIPSVDASDFEAVPGSVITFELPYAPSAICFTWQMFVGNDMPQTGNSYQRGGASRFFLVKHADLNNAEESNEIAGQIRLLEECMGQDPTATGSPLGEESSIAPAFSHEWLQRFRMRDRTWSGHYLWTSEFPTANNSVDFTDTHVSPQWYTAGIKMWSESPHTRVRVRNMKYIAFK